MEKIPNTPGIYMLLNSVNGKKYIGSTLLLRTRIAQHFNKMKDNTHDNKYLQNSYNKYGEVFISSILELCEPEILIGREQYYIDSIKPEYNICKVAGRTSGYIHTEESKMNMSISKKKLYQEGLKVWNDGISPTEETRNKISNTLKGRYTGENHPFYGGTHTEEAKKLMAAASHRRKGTHHTGQKGRVFKLDKVTLDVIAAYSSAPAAAETLIIQGTIETAGNKIGEAAKYARNAYGFKWVFEKDLDQVKVDELLESLRVRSISSQAIDTSIEGSETT